MRWIRILGACVVSVYGCHKTARGLQQDPVEENTSNNDENNGENTGQEIPVPVERVDVDGSVRLIVRVNAVAVDVLRTVVWEHVSFGVYRNHPSFMTDAGNSVVLAAGVGSVEEVVGDYAVPEGEYGVVVLRWHQEGDAHVHETYVETPLWQVQAQRTWVLHVLLDLDAASAQLQKIQPATDNVLQNPLWQVSDGVLDSAARYDANYPVFLKASSTAHPQCRWECSDPVCPAWCDPVCMPPVCHSSCQPQLYPPECTCDVMCERPECEIKCPDDGCPSDSCPQCITVCRPPVCVNRCSEGCEVAPPLCTAQCEPVDCAWNCRKPTCPQPECSLKCDGGL